MSFGRDAPKDDLTKLVQAARRDPTRVVLEGLHSVKHAMRFGAPPRLLVSDDPDAVLTLATQMAPDIVDRIAAGLQRVSPAVFATLAHPLPPTRLVAVVDRPGWRMDDIGSGPVVVLDRPSHPGNLGAVVRTAAAAGAAAVLTIGGVDPWSAAALRGAAGLQFALPVVAVAELPDVDRPILALADAGEPIVPMDLPENGTYLFGSERDGLAPSLRAAAARTLAIPMRAGVSSLNLATAVAVVLYLQRLAAPRGAGASGTGQPGSGFT